MTRRGGKNTILRLAILVLSAVATLFAPLSSFAAVGSQENTFEQTFYVSNASYSFEVGSLLFKDIRFVDYSATTTESFGLIGEMTNSATDPVYYKIFVKYYTAYGSTVATSYSTKTADAGTSSFAMMSDDSYLERSGYSIGSIDYYVVTVYILDSLEGADFTPSNDPRYSSEDYVIDGYDIDVIVNEDRTFTIREHITAYFDPTASKHGIIRKIPLSGTLKRNNGTTDDYRARVTEENVSGAPYTTSRSDGYFNIKIGSASHTVSGQQEYVITYTYNMGKDPLKNVDELYLNLIGTDWDTVIGNVKFDIHMPKSFDAGKLGFSVGKSGSTNSDDVLFEVNGNDISGSYHGILGEHEGLSVRLELPEGYFVGAGFKTSPIAYLTFIVPAICLIIAFVLWYLVGRDTNKLPEAVQFYPPDGMNSLDASFYYNGKADSSGIISLLIYLANKGYIGIIEDADGKNYQIAKLKEYDGNDENEADFMNGLFRNAELREEDWQEIIATIRSGNVPTQAMVDAVHGKSETPLGVVDPKKLRNKFYTTINKIERRVNKKSNIKKIMHNTRWASLIASALCVITFVSILSIPLFMQGDSDIVIIMFFSSLFIMPFVSVLFMDDVPVVFRIVWGCFLILPMLAIFGDSNMLAIFLEEQIYAFSAIFGLVCTVGILICRHYMPKRTAYGAEMYAKVNGFRRFLETAEKDQIEMIGNENPHYFYDILPYMYALGISNKYMKKFESLAEAAPEWYTGYDHRMFSCSDFTRSINRTMSTATSYMTSSPSSSSGGGSSGGGSSGGGSSGGGSSGGGGGGGGGSSW